MKIIMKTALLFAVLCCALLPQSSDGQMASGIAKQICCPGVGSYSKIPLKRLEYYYWTSSICPFHQVVFVTKAERHLCRNSDDEWVKKTMKAIDKKLGS
ncbi:C-C motif chemokine 22-like [Danio aesculapii]|uniref:C-C motif chemokine 22-like n=1 Tax=Danio aesculapii TaxID=1142201 RepID=UPI0024BF7B29|nr:C-C motif chemokine 22-like [Danio aesculapii]